MAGTSLLVMGDQLNQGIGALAQADPSSTRILMVESAAKVRGRPWHRQRLHLIITAMRRFAEELEAEGFTVDYRQAPTFTEGIAAHVARHRPELLLATEPNSRAAEALLRRAGFTLVRSNQFLCHRDEFADFMGDRPRLTMEEFYRHQRRRHGYLMDGGEPEGGRWNLDEENRLPLPRGPHDWPKPLRHQLDALDAEVIAGLPDGLPGSDPAGWWPTSRTQALAQLEHVIVEVLPGFGPYEDAMSSQSWHLGHSLLSAALNLGLLLPREVLDAVEVAYRGGGVPLASAEGLVRQVLGWREFVWGLYWKLGPGYLDRNELGATLELPPAFTGARTDMACLGSVLADVERYGWTHHIPRLVVLANLAMTAGVSPQALTAWMHERFVDGAEWVMGPNVVGMGTFADGGIVATKPYATGGAYIDKMSNFCKGCRYNRKLRVGSDACPYTTLYWDFLQRHRARLLKNARVARQVRGFDRLVDADAIPATAAAQRMALGAGTL